MKKISSAALVIVTFAVVFAVGFFVLLYPRLQEFGKMDAKLAAYTESVSPVKSDEAKKVAAQKEQLAANAEKVTKLLPNESSLYDLSIQLEALVKSVGIGLTSIQLTPAGEASGQSGTTSAQAGGADVSIKAPAGTQKAQVSLNVSGPYDKLQAYIDGMTSLDRFIEVTELTFSKVSTTDSNLNMQISANAYYMTAAKK